MSNWFYLNELIYFNNCSNNVQRHRALVNMALYKCCILLLLLLILSDKNRGNVDSTCHQPVIYDVVTVNNCYLWYFPDANLFMPTHSLHS